MVITFNTRTMEPTNEEVIVVEEAPVEAVAEDATVVEAGDTVDTTADPQ